MNETELTPKQIVAQLDKYIVGQAEAKKSVAIALRNRWRRKHLSEELQDEIIPKNILLIGPTGVGKTEIARRLARLVGAPFIKVEATKYTEVGYVGRDVEQIIRDLVANAIRMVQEQASASRKKLKLRPISASSRSFGRRRLSRTAPPIPWMSFSPAMMTKKRTNRSRSKRPIPTVAKRCSTTSPATRWTNGKSK